MKIMRTTAGIVVVAVWYLTVMMSTAAAGTTKCYDRQTNYKCYGTVHKCPPGCPNYCEMDCKACKPTCPCDKPGGLCGDPRFIGGDGIMFYFHGKKDADFCLVSDPNLHINAHLIGKRREGMKRDLTWVQSIGVMFGKHKLLVGAAEKVSGWEDSVDHLSLALDGHPLTLPAGHGVTLSADTEHGSMTISRLERNNAVSVEVGKMFKITARVVPITQEESRVHNYGITPDIDCFAHLELGFKFYSLTPDVGGVLGQTYNAHYKSPVKMGVAMPLIGGDANFYSSSLFSADCKVSRFNSTSNSVLHFSCASGIGGRGIICRK